MKNVAYVNVTIPYVRQARKLSCSERHYAVAPELLNYEIMDMLS
jgi:hypothetical protein